MSTDGTPEASAKRCGAEIARLRTTRRWSRAKLIARLLEEIDPSDPNYDTLSEAWLSRLEGGRMVKISRQILDALCRALRCSHQERARVFLYADRNVLTPEAHDPDPVAEALNYVMDRLYAETHEVLDSLFNQRRAADLDEEELLELVEKAMEMWRKLRQRQRSRPS